MLRCRAWLSILCVALFALAGCGGGSGGTDSTTPATGSLSGQVLDAASGAALAGVTVSASALSATTDASGQYTLAGVPAASTVVLRFATADHAPAVKATAFAAGASVTLDARLAPVALTTTFDAAAGATLDVPGSSARVVLPAAGLVDAASGAAASGTVTARITPIAPALNPANMPGSYAATASGGASTTIESFGALNVELADASGRRLNLAGGQTATIRIPVSTRSTDLPATIPLFYLDESTGLWVEEGTATLQGTGSGAYYEGTVRHFTTWNADQRMQTVFLTGCVEDTTGKRLANASVQAVGSDYSGSASATANANGQFSVAMRLNGTAAVYASVGDRTSNVLVEGPLAGAKDEPNCLRVPNKAAAPQVVMALTGQTVSLGDIALFMVQAVGAEPFVYRWSRNGIVLPDTNTPVLPVGPVAASDDGATFAVTVSNAQGTLALPAVTLHVGAAQPPLILASPTDQTVLPGATATFSVNAVPQGAGTLGYQWQRNGQPINGATGATYTTPPTTTADDGAVFTVVISASSGSSATTSGAVLHVTPPVAPSITSQSTSLTVNVGQAASFGVVAGGVPAPSYQWRRNGQPITGATAATYTLATTTAADNGAVFSVVVANAGGSVTSADAVLTVVDPQGGSGLYLLGGSGQAVNMAVTYAGGSVTYGANVLSAVKDGSAGAGALVLEPAGTALPLVYGASQATVSGDSFTGWRQRFGVYIKGGRFFAVDLAPTSGTPTSRPISTMTSSEVCALVDGSGLPDQMLVAPGDDWKDPARSWVFLRAPGPDGVCNSADDTWRALRMNMAAGDVAPTLGEPVAPLRNVDGSLAGMVVRNGNKIQLLSPDLGAPVDVFTVDGASFFNLGMRPGGQLPGLWVFSEGGSVSVVALGTLNRVRQIPLLAGQTLAPALVSQGQQAWFAINAAPGGTGALGSVIYVVNADPAQAWGQVALLTNGEPIASLDLTPTRVVARLASTPASAWAFGRNGTSQAKLIALGSGEFITGLAVSGETVYANKSSLLSNSLVIVNSDGTNAETRANTVLVERIGPSTLSFAAGLQQTSSLLVANGVRSAFDWGGAALQVLDGSTRAVKVGIGSLPATLTAFAVQPQLLPLASGAGSMLQLVDASTNPDPTTELFWFRADAPGLVRVTNNLSAASAAPRSQAQSAAIWRRQVQQQKR